MAKGWGTAQGWSTCNMCKGLGSIPSVQALDQVWRARWGEFSLLEPGGQGPAVSRGSSWGTTAIPSYRALGAPTPTDSRTGEVPLHSHKAMWLTSQLFQRHPAPLQASEDAGWLALLPSHAVISCLCSGALLLNLLCFLRF